MLEPTISLIKNKPQELDRLVKRCCRAVNSPSWKILSKMIEYLTMPCWRQGFTCVFRKKLSFQAQQQNSYSLLTVSAWSHLLLDCPWTSVSKIMPCGCWTSCYSETFLILNLTTRAFTSSKHLDASSILSSITNRIVRKVTKTAAIRVRNYRPLM